MKQNISIQSALDSVPESLRPLSQLRVANKRKAQALFIFLCVGVDALMVYAALHLAYTIRFDWALPIFKLDVEPSVPVYEQFILLLTPIWVALFAAYGLYRKENRFQSKQEARLLFQACSLGVIGVVTLNYLAPYFVFARGWITLAWVLSIVLTNLGRFFARMVTRKLHAAGLFNTPALIIGANAEGKLLAEQLRVSEYSGFEITGFVDQDLPLNETAAHGLKVLGRLENIQSLIEQHGVEEVIVASSALSEEQIVDLFTTYGVAGAVNIRLSSGLYQIITTSMHVEEFACVPLVRIDRVRLTGVNQFLKRAVDLVVAIIALALLSPFFAIAAVLVKLDSPGTVFYRRRVMGVNGREFDAFKFRTMLANGNEILKQYPALEKELEENGKLKDDPRVTRVGKYLRKISFDEMPQLWNVVRGEMSVVGPRMICPKEMDVYAQHGMNLLTVKPGITGLWQVSGRSDLPYSERIRLDMYYIRNWSLWFDIQILWRTIPAVLQRRGAY